MEASPAAAGAVGFAEVAPALAEFLRGSDYHGFNVASFDLPLLANEFARAGVRLPDGPDVCVIDSMVIYHCNVPKRVGDNPNLKP